MKLSRRRFLMGAGGGFLIAGSSPWLKTVQPAAAQTPASSLSAIAIWDGPSGVTSVYFNAGALLPWRTKGGDWLDANGVPGGTAPYGATALAGVGVMQMDITTLVRQWYATGNSGAYLQAAGAGGVASRSHSDPTKWPALLLIDAAGTVTSVPCVCSAMCDTSTEYAVSGTAFTLGSNKNLLLQFDLPDPQPDFVSALLSVNKTYSYSDPLSLKVFDVLQPKLYDGSIVPSMGIAEAYVGDVGLDAHPDVYFTQRFDESDWTKAFANDAWNGTPLFIQQDGWISPHSAIAMDSDLGVPAINTQFNVGSLTASSLDHRWSTKRYYYPTRNPNNGLLIREELPSAEYMASANSDCPSELYFRYYLKLKAGYQCSVEGKKLPGLAGRYGTWTGDDRYGYYVADSGNGGAPTSGASNGTTLSGWSMRHHAYQGPHDANPLGDLIALNYYAYFVGMVGYFGNYWRWGSADLGYVNIEMDRWYCIEHYVKVNTVDGPYDEHGNGTALPDGIVRGWLDGALVFARNDVILRKNPAIKVDEVWLDHYHGGTTPAEAVHPFAMAALVVARKYVGPIQTGTAPTQSSALPAWLNGKPMNTWIAVAGTALQDSSAGAQVTAGLAGPSGQATSYGSPKKGIMDYSGGSLKRDGSEMMIFGGGGAGAWAGNDVRSLRLEDDWPNWRTVIAPSRPSALWPSSGDGRTAHPYMQDGTPNARHSYWQPQFLDSTATFMTFGCQNVWETDNGTFNTVDGAPLAKGAWNPAGTYPNIPAPRGYDGSWVCKDPRNDDVYASSAQAIHKFVAATNSWSTLYSSASANGMDRGCAAIDTKRGLLLRIGLWGSSSNRPLTINLATGAPTIAAFSGPSAASVISSWAAGFVYDPLLDAFLLFLDDGYLYSIKYASDAEWSVTQMPLAGVAPTAHASTVHSGGPCAIWGRMQYVPNLRGVCILQRFDRPAYFVRTAE